jgi:hypothetical protein
MVSFPSCGQDIGSWSSDEDDGDADVDVPLTVAESGGGGGGGCSESVGRFIVRVTRQLLSNFVVHVYIFSLTLFFQSFYLQYIVLF